MATRSTIAIEYADGTVGQVYCHWDGYLEHNGRILQEHYSNPFILRDLIDLGDISSLGPKVGTKHPFSKFEIDSQNPDFDKLIDQVQQADKEGYTTFYGRDRGETGIAAKTFKSFEDYKENHQYEEYEYILRQINGKAVWFVSKHDGPYVPLTEQLETIKEEETV